VTVFFFQAEDGIRDGHVTGVQTCALPIYEAAARGVDAGAHGHVPRLRARSRRRAAPEPVPDGARRSGEGGAGRSVARRRDAPSQIGRASCRERVYTAVGGRVLETNSEAIA